MGAFGGRSLEAKSPPRRCRSREGHRSLSLGGPRRRTPEEETLPQLREDQPKKVESIATYDLAAYLDWALQVLGMGMPTGNEPVYVCRVIRSSKRSTNMPARPCNATPTRHACKTRTCTSK